MLLLIKLNEEKKYHFVIIYIYIYIFNQLIKQCNKLFKS